MILKDKGTQLIFEFEEGDIQDEKMFIRNSVSALMCQLRLMKRLVKEVEE